MSSHVGTTPALTLDRVIGQTCLHNNALAVNPVTGDVAYPAGCVVVIYQPRRNRQFRYFRAGKAVSCLNFSQDGSMLAVGERGHRPSVTVWSLATGAVLRALVGVHRFGISCVVFSPGGGALVTMGFRHDRMLRVWDLQLEGDMPADGAGEGGGRDQTTKAGSGIDPAEDARVAASSLPFQAGTNPDAPPPPPGKGSKVSDASELSSLEPEAQQVS
ncbi:unnamed protein product [Choristocarpus tenellus]